MWVYDYCSFFKRCLSSSEKGLKNSWTFQMHNYITCTCHSKNTIFPFFMQIPASINIKEYMTKFFITLFKSFQSDEEWHLFYCDSTLGG